MKTKINANPREQLLRGVNTMADAVGSTLGPCGQNVAIAKIDYHDRIFDRVVLHDGVSVAKAIDLPDEDENMGAQLLKEASQKQVDMVGDGTTAVMLLAQALIQECFKVIATGVNPMTFASQIERARAMIETELKSLSTPIANASDAVHIATISANDPYLGELVAKTLTQVGVDGVVTVEESKNADTIVEHQDGMQLANGYLHEKFVTNPDRMEAILENPRLLLLDAPLTSIVPLIPLLEDLQKAQQKLVVIAPDIVGDALPSLLQNKLEGKFQSLCVRAPSFGQNQKDILQDIAIMTGGTFFTTDAGYKLEDITADKLGTADSVTSTKTETIIVGGDIHSSAINERIASIKTALESETSEFEKAKLKERIAKLSGGVSVIYVGGFTEVEMKERRERVLDAVAATQAALRSGIVPGGEVVYLQAREALDKTSLGSQILYRALEKPFYKLLSNAGLDPGEYKQRLLSARGIDNLGVNVLKAQVVDMLQEGIIDPVAVPINAVNNAVSVALKIMTTGTLVIPFNEYKIDARKLGI